MRASRLVHSLLLISLLLPWLGWLPVGAQSPGEASIYVHTVGTPENVTSATGPALSLGMTFSLLDAEGQVMRGVDLGNNEQTTLELGPDSYSALVQGIATPWSVVLLVDASKTMANFSASATYKNAKNAFVTALGQAPRDGSYAVLAFNDTAPLQLDFTADTEKIGAALKKVTAKTNGNACLNDGLYEAVNKLSAVPGRRAVIVLTASADNCATHSTEEVVHFAQQSEVQIYAVGLKGYTVTPEQLEAISHDTGGLSAMQPETALVFALSNMFTVLASQWQAKVQMYPTAGTQTAQLKVTLADNTVLRSAPIQFTSPQAYIRPTQIELKGRVLSTLDGLQFNLAMVSPEKISKLNVSVISSDTEAPVSTQTLSSFGETNVVAAGNLETGKQYVLRVEAVDVTGTILAVAEKEFEFKPPQAGMAISAVQNPTYDDPRVVISITTQNLNAAVKFKIWLADAQNKGPIPGTETVIPVGEPLIIPIAPKGLATGEYTVNVQALDAQDTLVAEAAPGATAYVRPSDSELLFRWLKASPYAIAGLTGVCCLGAGVLVGMIWLLIPKKATRTKSVDLVLPEKRRASHSIGLDDSGIMSAPPAAALPPSTPQPVPAAARPASPVSANLPTAYIHSYAPPEIKFSAQIRSTPFTVGRRQGNHAVLPVGNSSGVSGQHLTISYNNGQFYVQDDNSTYGSTLNGQPLPKRQPVPLTDGAILGLGPKVQIKFSRT